MGSCCLSGALHNHATPVGKETTLDGLACYISEPKDKSKKRALIFLTDVFGYKLPNTRLLADQYAEAGFYVYVPDILNDDPLDISLLKHIEPPLKDYETAGLIDKAKNTAIMGAALGTWLPKHTEGTTLPLVEKAVAAVKAVPGTEKVGVIGFCFGGRYAILMAHGKVDAAYACHPSLVAIPGDFEPVTKPLSIAVGTRDTLLDDKSNDQIKEILDKKQNTEVVKYQDQVHGFTLRGDWSSDKDKKAMDDALKQGITWFSQYLGRVEAGINAQ